MFWKLFFFFFYQSSIYDTAVWVLSAVTVQNGKKELQIKKNICTCILYTTY